LIAAYKLYCEQAVAILLPLPFESFD